MGALQGEEGQAAAPCFWWKPVVLHYFGISLGGLISWELRAHFATAGHVHGGYNHCMECRPPPSLTLPMVLALTYLEITAHVSMAPCQHTEQLLKWKPSACRLFFPMFVGEKCGLPQFESTVKESCKF